MPCPGKDNTSILCPLVQSLNWSKEILLKRSKKCLQWTESTYYNQYHTVYQEGDNHILSSAWLEWWFSSSGLGLFVHQLISLLLLLPLGQVPLCIPSRYLWEILRSEKSYSSKTGGVTLRSWWVQSPSHMPLPHNDRDPCWGKEHSSSLHMSRKPTATRTHWPLPSSLNNLGNPCHPLGPTNPINHIRITFPAQKPKTARVISELFFMGFKGRISVGRKKWLH